MRRRRWTSALIVLDPTSRQVASAKQTSTLGIKPATVARAGAVPVSAHVQTHIELDPGDYEVRVAVADQKTGARGSVFSQITVPKFASAALSVSDIAIEAGPNKAFTGRGRRARIDSSPAARR